MSAAHPVVTKKRAWWVRSRAWIGISIMTPFVIASVLSPPLAPEGSWPDIAFDLIGWFLFIVGGVFRWWATLYIGGRKLETIVSDGPYSICRNPLYVGTFLMGLAIAFFLQSLTFGVGFAIAAIFYMSVTVPAEEIMLGDKFGQVFTDYCQKVPRFFPKLRLLNTPAKIVINVGGLRSEALRTARWVWLPVICDLMAHLRLEAWWPKILHLP